MPLYNVKVPYAGYVSIEVEAEDEDDAIESALNHTFAASDVQEGKPLATIDDADFGEAEVELVDEGNPEGDDVEEEPEAEDESAA